MKPAVLVATTHIANILGRLVPYSLLKFGSNHWSVVSACQCSSQTYGQSVDSYQTNSGISLPLYFGFPQIPLTHVVIK